MNGFQTQPPAQRLLHLLLLRLCQRACSMTTGVRNGTPACSLATLDCARRFPGVGCSCPRRATCAASASPPSHWLSSVPVGRCAARATHSSERCGGWPPPVLQRRCVAHVATTSAVVAAVSAARRAARKGASRKAGGGVRTRCYSDVSADITARMHLIRVTERLGVRLPASPSRPSPRQPTTVGHRGLLKSAGRSPKNAVKNGKKKHRSQPPDELDEAMNLRIRVHTQKIVKFFKTSVDAGPRLSDTRALQRSVQTSKRGRRDDLEIQVHFQAEHKKIHPENS